MQYWFVKWSLFLISRHTYVAVISLFFRIVSLLKRNYLNNKLFTTAGNVQYVSTLYTTYSILQELSDVVVIVAVFD